MFGDFMGKLQEAQQKMQEAKDKLADMTVEGEAGDGAVKVVLTGAREVKSIEVGEQLLAVDKKEELEDMLIIALNRALENAEKLHEEHMQGVAGNMLGGMGMGGF